MKSIYLRTIILAVVSTCMLSACGTNHKIYTKKRYYKRLNAGKKVWFKRKHGCKCPKALFEQAPQGNC